MEFYDCLIVRAKCRIESTLTYSIDRWARCTFSSLFTTLDYMLISYQTRDSSDSGRYRYRPKAELSLGVLRTIKLPRSIEKQCRDDHVLIDWKRYPNGHFLMFQTTFYALFDVSSLNYLILFILLEILIGL
jgi:hypothetical protein